MSDVAFRSLHDFNEGYERYEVTAKDGKTTAVKIILLVLCLLLVLEALIYLVAVPCMGSVAISWNGLQTYSEVEMNKAIGPLAQKNWVHFKKYDAKSLIASMPGVESVQVVKHFPDRVSINVTERTPVAMTFVAVGDRTVPVQIDRHGVLFPLVAGTNEDAYLPIISGIPVENIPEGMRLPSRYHALLEQISEIRSISPNYFAAVSEIHVVPKEYGNYELVLFPINSRTKILTDRQLNKDALDYMMVVLDVVNTLEQDVSEIDLRYGSVSYRSREFSSGAKVE